LAPCAGGAFGVSKWGSGAIIARHYPLFALKLFLVLNTFIVLLFLAKFETPNMNLLTPHSR
jgi:hypothetical protein